jgi:hypothetical protein
MDMVSIYMDMGDVPLLVTYSSMDMVNIYMDMGDVPYSGHKPP